MSSETIIVLGRGVGGLVTATELLRRLGKEHRIILADREDKHVFWPSLLWLQVSLRKPEGIWKPLASPQKRGIEVLIGEAQSIDTQNKSVTVNDQELRFDYLVVALGAELAPQRIPGLEEAGYNLYTVEGAQKLSDARISFTNGNLAVVVAETPFKCPAAPYEAAMLLEHDLCRRKVRDAVSVALFTPEPGPMGVAGPTVSAGVRQLVESRNISYYPQHKLESVNPVGQKLRFAGGIEFPYDFLVYIPPHVPPKIIRESGLMGDNNWAHVDRGTMETACPGIFAIGDVTSIPLSMGLPLPKAGVFAHRQGQAVARNIAAKISGKPQTNTFDGHGECFVEIGGGKAGFGRGNFYAEPNPAIKLHKAGRHWHAAKVLFEKNWMRRLR